MPFTSETARIAGQEGGSVTSEKKRLANRENMLKAKRDGKMTGRPTGSTKPSVCTCGRSPHKSTCRVYLAEKKRESRARLGQG